MTRASSICWALFAAVLAGAFLAQVRAAEDDARLLAVVTASECYVYSYQRDVLVTRLATRRLAYGCRAAETRARDG